MILWLIVGLSVWMLCLCYHVSNRYSRAKASVVNLVEDLENDGLIMSKGKVD